MYQRLPSAPEIKACLHYVETIPSAAAFRSGAPLDAWTKLAHALFQTNEAIVVG